MYSLQRSSYQLTRIEMATLSGMYYVALPEALYHVLKNRLSFHVRMAMIMTSCSLIGKPQRDYRQAASLSVVIVYLGTVVVLNIDRNFEKEYVSPHVARILACTHTIGDSPCQN